MSECLICKEKVKNTAHSFHCKHQFCEICSFEYLRLRIIEGDVMKISCPLHDCPYLITSEEILKIVGQDLHAKYTIFLRNSQLSQNPSVRFCPITDCQGYDFGSSQKHKLSCNVCNSNFCYYCNEKWHPDASCKNLQDIKFDKWSISHDVKYCPSCKRRIEKNGGCPSMECPVCKARFCWYCGKDLQDGHDPILCVFAKDSWNLRYWFVFFLIFGPVTIPFGPGIFFIHIAQNYLTDSDKESKVISKIIKWKWVTYVVIILVSPAIFVLMLLGSGVFVIYIHRVAFKPYRTGCYRKCFKNKVPRYLLMAVISLTVSLIVISISVLVVALSPLVGSCFLVGKIYSDLCSMRPDHKQGYVKI